MKVTRDRHRQYLVRTARELSRAKDRKVSPKEVLEALVDLAILDEGIYDPQDTRVISAERRAIQTASEGLRTTRFGRPELQEALAFSGSSEDPEEQP